MANSVVITQQPTVTNNAEPVETGWNSDLLNCCDDMKSCCYGFWCCPCLACDTTAKLGENNCFPLIDICCPAILASAIGIPLYVPPGALAVRVAIRYKYKIKGSLCNDTATSCFCMWCSWCQMARELKYRKKGPTIHNAQTSNTGITIIQNAPTVSNPQVHMVRQDSYPMPASQPVSYPMPASQPVSYPMPASQPVSYPMPASQPVFVPAPGYAAQPPVGFADQPPAYPGHLSQQDSKDPMFNNKYW